MEGIVTYLFATTVLLTGRVMGRSVGYSMDAVVILQNLTVPCQEMEIDPYGMPVEHLELSDADMTQILKEQGGDYANTFLARNIEEADTNLPSLIAIDAKTKDAILSNMVSGAYGFTHIYDSWISRGTIKQYLLKKQKDNQPNGLRLARSLEKQQNVPFILPQEAGLEETYRAPLGVEKLDYCLTRGEFFIDPQHLRMCTVCNSLREMDDSIWPRYINEAICSPKDSSCLLVEGTPHGACRENLMPVHVLKKQPGACVLTFDDGQTYVADYWQKETISIRVGCECTVKTTSWLSSYV